MLSIIRISIRSATLSGVDEWRTRIRSSIWAIAVSCVDIVRRDADRAGRWAAVRADAVSRVDERGRGATRAAGYASRRRKRLPAGTLAVIARRLPADAENTGRRTALVDCRGFGN